MTVIDEIIKRLENQIENFHILENKGDLDIYQDYTLNILKEIRGDYVTTEEHIKNT